MGELQDSCGVCSTMGFAARICIIVGAAGAGGIPAGFAFLLLEMRKLLYLQFAVFAVIVAVMGLAAFGLLMWDFQFPGTFKRVSLLDGGMSMDLVLLLLFGLQHSLMARQGFKRAMQRLVPRELERSFYVLFSGFMLFLLTMLWCPMRPPLYDLQGTVWGWLLLGGVGLGLVLMGMALMAVDALDLIGIRSVLRLVRAEPLRIEPLKTPHVYRLVRHPLYLGMLLVFWLTPTMTHDHLFFAEVMTAYVLIGMHFEERDLVALYGDQYRRYQLEVPMIVPFLPRGRRRGPD